MNYGIGNVKDKSKSLFTTTTAPTESGDVITLATTDIIESGFKVGDYLAYVDSGNISALYSISAISSGTATLSLVGAFGGGGKQLYQHNVKLQHDAYSLKVWFNFISESNTPMTDEADLVSALKASYNSANNSLMATGCFNKSGTYSAVAVFVYNNTDIYIFGLSGLNADLFTNVNVDTTITDTVVAL